MHPEEDAVRANPFPGLRPFREEEEYLFFGRGKQIDEMVDKLAETRFLAVVGASGSGKSSLVNCGLRPALHRGLMARAGTSWRVAQFRPGGNPIRAMARALAEEDVLFSDPSAGAMSLEDIVETTLRLSKLGLLDIYAQARLGEGGNLLVVVDQFEELFRYRRLSEAGSKHTYGVSEEAVAFVNLLLEVQAQTTYPVYVALTMRSDFLGDCAQFPGLPEAINEGQFLVPRMSRSEGRNAIAGPIRVGEVSIASVLLTRLVNDVGDNPDQLSILQHALNRTWACWEAEGQRGPLTLAHYAQIGTMAHALDQHAEQAYAELSAPRQRLCEKLFKALTDKGTDARGIRRPTKLDTLCALTGASQAEVEEVIEVFRAPSRSFLMPPLPDVLDAETVIDISHESLMRVWERLKRWVEEEAESARMYRRLAETARLHEAGKASLWQDTELQLALDWRDKETPTAAWAERYHPDIERARQFLERSREAQERSMADAEKRREEEVRRRWGRRIAWVAGIAAVVSLAFAVSAWYNARKAVRQEALAQRRLERIQEGIELKWAMLSGNPKESFPRWEDFVDARIQFRVRATYRFTNQAGRPIYNFELIPRFQSERGGRPSIALITYRLEHPSFHNSLFATGPKEDFTASYDGWGCMRKVIAVVEFRDPDRLPSVASFDMCGALEGFRPSGEGVGGKLEIVPIPEYRKE